MAKAEGVLDGDEQIVVGGELIIVTDKSEAVDDAVLHEEVGEQALVAFFGCRAFEEVGGGTSGYRRVPGIDQLADEFGVVGKGDHGQDFAIGLLAELGAGFGVDLFAEADEEGFAVVGIEGVGEALDPGFFELLGLVDPGFRNLHIDIGVGDGLEGDLPGRLREGSDFVGDFLEDVFALGAGDFDIVTIKVGHEHDDHAVGERDAGEGCGIEIVGVAFGAVEVDLGSDLGGEAEQAVVVEVEFDAVAFANDAPGLKSSYKVGAEAQAVDVSPHCFGVVASFLDGGEDVARVGEVVGEIEGIGGVAVDSEIEGGDGGDPVAVDEDGSFEGGIEVFVGDCAVATIVGFDEGDKGFPDVGFDIPGDLGVCRGPCGGGCGYEEGGKHGC